MIQKPIRLGIVGCSKGLLQFLEHLQKNKASPFVIRPYKSLTRFIKSLDHGRFDCILIEADVMSGKFAELKKKTHLNAPIVIVSDVFSSTTMYNAVNYGYSGYLLWTELYSYSVYKQIASLVDHHFFIATPTVSTELANFVVSSVPNLAGQQENLTMREREIAQLLISGLKYKEIADCLSISLNTVSSHVFNVYRKIGVKNRVEALNYFKSKYK